jgi:hypothetical protein
MKNAAQDHFGMGQRAPEIQDSGRVWPGIGTATTAPSPSRIPLT